MDSVLLAIAALTRLLQVALLVAAALLFIIAAVDWLVRTRRINPFGPLARFFRRTVHPFMEPVERRVVRAGGLPSNAPWWAFLTLVVAGIVLLMVLGWVRDQIFFAATMGRAGSRGVYVLVVSWGLGILEIALLVRVVASWFRMAMYAWWIRWTVVITEPFLAPLRRVLPTVGMFDISPLVAWFAILLLRGLLLRGA